MKHTIGKPLFKHGDKVSFEVNIDGKKTIYTGEVSIVDAWGTFFQDEEPSYDVWVEKYLDYEGRCLVKHIRESYLTAEI